MSLTHQFSQIIKLLFLFVLLFVSCFDDDKESAQILLSVSGECCADVRLFDTGGKQIDRQYYDCQETKQLIFNTNEFGLLVIHAEAPNGTTVKESVSAVSGKVSEVTISF